MFGGEGGILFCFFTFIAIAIILNLAICQVNLNSTKVIGKTVQQRIEQQQTSSARPPRVPGGVHMFTGVAVPISSAGAGRRARKSLAPPEDLLPTLLCVTGFLCDSKQLLLK